MSNGPPSLLTLPIRVTIIYIVPIASSYASSTAPPQLLAHAAERESPAYRTRDVPQTLPAQPALDYVLATDDLLDLHSNVEQEPESDRTPFQAGQKLVAPLKVCIRSVLLAGT